jgi:integrase
MSMGQLANRFQKPVDASDSDLIWPSEDYFVLQHRIRRRAPTLGIEFKGFGFHTLRRTYASLRYLIGPTATPGATLVRDMGHASEGMTLHYIRLDHDGIVEHL